MQGCLIVNLLVVSSPSPVPSINWRRVGGLPFPRKVDMRKASGVLEIPYFQQEDTGTYECVAENSRGMNMVKGKLSFYGKCMNISPARPASVRAAQAETQARHRRLRSAEDRVASVRRGRGRA